MEVGEEETGPTIPVEPIPFCPADDPVADDDPTDDSILLPLASLLPDSSDHPTARRTPTRPFRDGDRLGFFEGKSFFYVSDCPSDDCVS
jgi:hypothetical protein